MKKKSCVFCFLLLFSAFLSAQTAAEMEEMLKTEALSYEQAALFVLKAADLPDSLRQLDLNNSAGAFRFAAEQKWLPKKALSGNEASLEGVSLLLMRAFEIKGGLFFSLFKNPHYAYREMVYQDIIQGRTDPEMAVSGDHLLFLVSRILSRQEEEAELTLPGKEQRNLAAEAQRAAEREALAAEINTRLSASAVADTSARITDQGVTIRLSNIQFLPNSAELPEAEKRKLQEIGRILRVVSQRKILVTGHTAMAGTAADRLKTSQERAAAVAAYLVFLGVRRSDEVFAQGLGAERPVADNNTPEGMALNRRVEIIIMEDLR